MTKTDAIALKIVNGALKRVKEKVEPFTYAVNMLEPVPLSDLPKLEQRAPLVDGLATDGKHLFFDSSNILKIYEGWDAQFIEFQIIHILIHGFLGHFEDTNYTRKKLAWSVMDLAVSRIIREMKLDFDFDETPYASASDSYKTMGMSLYYQSLQDKRKAANVLREGRKIRKDDHSFWWDLRELKKGQIQNKAGNGSGAGSGEQNLEEEANKKAMEWEKAREYLLGTEEKGKKLTEKKLKDVLKKSGGYGSETEEGRMTVTADKDHLSFQEVFRDFLNNQFVSKDNADYFDTMLYQYGLELYGDIPLIEPLEEIEEVKLTNLVIAIDTSGSCADYESLFLSQLIGIFGEISKRISFERIYLIQCDSSIKNISSFEKIEELSQVKKSMNMYGFGGTSFRPVFHWIDTNLIQQAQKVDCLLYFSDAEGDFPQNAPDYPTYFVMPEMYAKQRYSKVPGWVKRVYLGKKLTMEKI